LLNQNIFNLAKIWFKMMPYLLDVPLPSTIQEWLLLTAVIAASIGLLAFLFGPDVVPRLYSHINKKTPLADAPNKSTNENEPINGSKTNINNIPYPLNPNFTGRESLLNSLRNALISGGTTALTQTQTVTGLGGVGKTQLALEYAYRHINDYEVIWWVRSEEPAILANDYIELADRLGLEKGSGKTEELIDAVRQWFENNAGWLLIFDNAQSPSDLTRYLPKIGSGHVIVTSRNPNWESLAKSLEVLVFERPESVKFLLKRTGQRDEKAAEALAEALGDLPLALEQAGAYVKETVISFEGYLKRFQEERNEILRYGKPDTYPETIATTWELSVKAASKETPESLDLLNLCTYLSPDLIQRSMLVQLGLNKPIFKR
jgi:hypothetical protein